MRCATRAPGRIAAINWNWLVPRRKGQVFVFISVIHRSLDVDDDGVVTDNFGGKVDGHDGEHGVSEGGQEGGQNRVGVVTAGGS